MNWDTIDDAIVAALATQDITCYPYEGPSLSKVPCATFVPDEPEFDVPGYMAPDQAFGVGKSQYKLRYYVSLEKDGRLAWRDMKAGITKIGKALGTDRDLGGAVRDLAITRARISPVRTIEGSRRELMCEMDVEIKPKPSIG